MSGTMTGSRLAERREGCGLTADAVARASGLLVSQVDALERGDLNGFASSDEMAAAASMYAAAVGIGMAEMHELLVGQPVAAAAPSTAETAIVGTIATDQSRADADDDGAARTATDGLRSLGRGVAAFSTAVRERSTRAARDIRQHSRRADVSESRSDAGSRHTPVTAEVHVEDADQPTGEIPIVGFGAGGELERWARARAAEQRAAESDVSSMSGARTWLDTTRRQLASAAAATRSSVNRRVRSDRPVDDVRPVAQRSASSSVVGGWQHEDGVRAWLRRSEHATLAAAIGCGFLLMGLFWGLGAMIGDTPPQRDAATPAAESKSSAGTPMRNAPVASSAADLDRGSAAAEAQPEPTEPGTVDDRTAVKRTVKPMLAPRAISVQVLNTGRRQGCAAEMARKLRARGDTIAKVGNSATKYGDSVILHDASLTREAQRLTRETGITTTDVIPAGGSNSVPTIVVVVS